MRKTAMMKHLLILCLLASFFAFAAIDPVSSQMLELKPGGNLVTLTRPIADESATLFLSLKPMMLDTKNKCYVRCASKDDLKVGVGYWIFSRTEQSPIDLVHDQAQTSYETAGLAVGWNLIGVADNSTWMNQAIEIWRWLNGKFQTITKEELTTGEAYWVNQ